jgi:phosphoribosyl-AMP cyclohydrolase
MVKLYFGKLGGLIPAVIQDWRSGEVLMLGFMNPEAFRKTLATGKVHFWSRSRKALWMKGETSRRVQLVKEVLVDCDRDALVVRVAQKGGASCHGGYRSCFYRRIAGERLVPIGNERVFDPRTVYPEKKGTPRHRSTRG